MALTRTKLQQIERRVQQKQHRQGETNLVVPSNWAEFAQMTKIRSGGDIKPFKPYPYQEELVNLMLERSVVVCKSRQLGVSEVITCFMLWRACLNPGYLGLVFSKTQTDSSLLARRMKRMIASLGLKTTTENLSDIEIQGHGRILFRNSKPDSARGIESVVDCFLDELAFLETGKQVYDALAPAMQMTGNKSRVFCVSTPNGRTGFYWDLLSSNNESRDIELICNQVSKGESKPFYYWVDSGGWGKVLIHWRCHPIYGSNPNFLQDIHEKQKLSWATIEQEYNLNFLESESNFFSADIVRGGAVGSYENPEKKTSYFLGVDSATVGEDYGVCVVLKRDNDGFSLVHLYRKRKETSQYHLFQIGGIIDNYLPVVVGVETNAGGQIWLEELVKSYRFIKFKPIHTSAHTKPTMLDRLKLLLEQRKFKYPHNCPIVDELLSFKRSNGRLGASPGKHDDVVMAVCFALAAAEET